MRKKNSCSYKPTNTTEIKKNCLGKKTWRFTDKNTTRCYHCTHLPYRGVWHRSNKDSGTIQCKAEARKTNIPYLLCIEL